MISHEEILGKELRKWIEGESENRPTAVAKLIDILLEDLHLSDVALVSSNANLVLKAEQVLVGRALTEAMKSVKER